MRRKISLFLTVFSVAGFGQTPRLNRSLEKLRTGRLDPESRLVINMYGAIMAANAVSRSIEGGLAPGFNPVPLTARAKLSAGIFPIGGALQKSPNASSKAFAAAFSDLEAYQALVKMQTASSRWLGFHRLKVATYSDPVSGGVEYSFNPNTKLTTSAGSGAFYFDLRQKIFFWRRSKQR